MVMVNKYMRDGDVSLCVRALLIVSGVWTADVRDAY